MSCTHAPEAVRGISSPKRVLHRVSAAHQRAWRALPTLTAALVGTILSITAGFMVSQWEDRHAIQEFNSVAENHYMVLQNGLNEYLNKLLTLRALFDSSDDHISRNEFEAFVRPHLQYSSPIQTLSWVPRVRRDERTAYEQAAVRDGFEGFRFKERAADDRIITTGEHDEYYPIYYSTVPKTSTLHGLDLRLY
jgi:diguanylate cyclase